MKLIKDWIFAIKVCRKYGIMWNPFFRMSHAEFRFWYWWNGDIRNCKARIYINPFYPKFIDSFIHEVGHCIVHESIYMKCGNTQYEMYYDNHRLKDEYLAWRFAKLVLKQRFDKGRARKMFMSYFPSQAKKHGSLVAADKYAKYDYNLSK